MRAGLPRLAELGIDAEVVRARPCCLVVRSATRSGAEALHGRAFVTAWLESLPRLAHRASGAVVESAERTRGSSTCIHTLLWQPPTSGEVLLASRTGGGWAVGAEPDRRRDRSVTEGALRRSEDGRRWSWLRRRAWPLAVRVVVAERRVPASGWRAPRASHGDDDLLWWGRDGCQAATGRAAGTVAGPRQGRPGRRASTWGG